MDRDNDKRVGKDDVTYNISTADRIYLQSERWKCEHSPTGAHHWLSPTGNIFVCIYCGHKRKYPISIDEALKFNKPAKLVDFMMSEDTYLWKHPNNGKNTKWYGRQFLPKNGQI
jgi:hypothetical protein